MCGYPFLSLIDKLSGTFASLVRISLQEENMSALRVATIAGWLIAGAAASNIQERLTVVIFDYAGVSRKVLLSAANEGRHAFGSAGVETEWILCDPVAGCSVPERFVQVKILSRPLEATPVSPQGLASTRTCTATEHCAASYIFFDRVAAFADDVHSPTDLTLAYVMVHEIGHLMGLGHRPGGIMTASFSSHDLRNAAVGWLCFAKDDARELRSAVRSQMANLPARHIKVPGWRGEVSE